MPRIMATPDEIEKYLAMLAETVPNIARAVEGLDEERLHTSPDGKGWSVAEILAHVRACSELWTHTIYAMLAENNPALPDIDARRWAKIVGYADRSFEQTFLAFSIQRSELLDVLYSLSDEQWLRSGTDADRKLTVFSQTRRMAKHDAEHYEQIDQAAAGLRRT